MPGEAAHGRSPSRNPADDGGARGLPDLPPEWGTVVIPDDPSELADEADALRREMRGSVRRARVRRALGLRQNQPSSLGIPVVIMTVAILTTLVSLLVVTWGNQPNGIFPTSGPAPVATSAPAPDMITSVPDLTFAGASGERVRLGDVLPVIFLLVDGCDCGKLISGVAGAVPPGVHVIPVTKVAPHPPTNDAANVVRVEDPAGTLRARFAADSKIDGSAGAIVVDSRGTVVAANPHVTQVSDVKPLDPS